MRTELLVVGRDRRTEDVAAEVVDVDEQHLDVLAVVREELLDARRHLVGLGRGQHHHLVERRDRRVAGAVDAARFLARDAVEVARPAEELRHDRHRGGEQDARRADSRIAISIVSGMPRPTPYGVFTTCFESRTASGRAFISDDRVGTPLGGRDHLLGHEEPVASRSSGRRVPLDDRFERVARQHHVGLDRVPLEADAVDRRLRAGLLRFS